MNWKKQRLVRLVETEEEHLLKQDHGSDEYNASLKRIMDLEKQIAEPTKMDRVLDTALKVVKVGAEIFIPIASLVYITAKEQETTYTGEAKKFFSGVFPKRH
jgi:hypothetical protein